MTINNLSPCVRFANFFSYYPKIREYIAGYDYRMFYIIDGNAFLKFEDCQYLISKHTIVLIPPGTFYKIIPQDDKPIDILCINFDTIKGEGRPSETVFPSEYCEFDSSKVFEKNLIPEFSKSYVTNDSLGLRELLFEIVRETSEKDFGFDKKAEALLTTTLISLVRNQIKSSEGKEVRIVSQIKEYIRENISEHLDAKLLGVYFHYHPNYLNRIFKENVGITLHNFVIDCRINYAKELLITSNVSLEKIATRCGYKTLSHFSLAFKKRCGVTPSDYRENNARIAL